MTHTLRMPPSMYSSAAKALCRELLLGEVGTEAACIKKHCVTTYEPTIGMPASLRRSPK